MMVRRTRACGGPKRGVGLVRVPLCWSGLPAVVVTDGQGDDVRREEGDEGDQFAPGDAVGDEREVRHGEDDREPERDGPDCRGRPFGERREGVRADAAETRGLGVCTGHGHLNVWTESPI